MCNFAFHSFSSLNPHSDSTEKTTSLTSNIIKGVEQSVRNKNKYTNYKLHALMFQIKYCLTVVFISGTEM